MRIMIFNYGAGNLFSIQAALKKEGVTPRVTKTGLGLEDADGIILPGVGSFDQAAKALPMGLLRDTIRAGKPVLGICLGLQLFFARSEEGSGGASHSWRAGSGGSRPPRRRRSRRSAGTRST